MINFRVIGIRPLKGCNKDYLKLLKADELYKFYKEYTIDHDDTIVFNPVAPLDLYQTDTTNKNQIEINISAISGKNGSGKSTIVELLFLAINNLSEQKNTKNVKADLEHVKYIRVEFYFKTDFYYKIRIYDGTISIYKYRKTTNKEEYKINKKEDTKFKLSNFFYTIAINYSHYAYNTRDSGTWLNGLFHKNDAYQTPLVLNPMRTEGNFDINVENFLVKARLLSNLLKPTNKVDFKKLTENLTATQLRIKINQSKIDKVLYEERIREKRIGNVLKDEIEKVRLKDLSINRLIIFKKLNRFYKFSYLDRDLNDYAIVYDYLLYKLVNICLTYVDYEKYFDKTSRNFNEVLLDDFFEHLLVHDTSHITYKLKQTLNYLQFKKDYLELKEQTVSIENMSTKIEDLRKKNKRKRDIKRIELLPPPVFNIDILLESDKIDGIIEFKMLSSGEKQMIYSVSSILYHLSYLDSVKNTRTKTAYKYINIVLEEIELYFHPEMQRTFIDTILEGIADMEFENISGINFCFVSHSPFILSDIPQENIMFLSGEDNIAEQINNIEYTFGANIHDLLKNGFFMKKGSIGAFAEKKIKETIKWLNEMLDLKEKDKLIFDESKHQFHKKIIDIIDEPIIKTKLLEMYATLFEIKREDRIKEQIERLGKEIGYEVVLNKKEAT